LRFDEQWRFAGAKDTPALLGQREGFGELLLLLLLSWGGL
jgi:hypothetical protein